MTSHLVIGIDDPLADFGGLLFGDSNGSGAQVTELFHTYLTTVDAEGRVLPRLAAALPSLDDGSWRVNPDGTMVAIYRLRPGLRWHDGAPFTARDLELSHASRLRDGMGPADENSGLTIRTVRALDPERVEVNFHAVHWRGNSLREALTPLPQHLLGALTGDEDLASAPYWTTGFVGLGPFQVARFTPGEVELRPFAGYAGGNPVVERMTLRGFSDARALQAAVVAEGVDVALSSHWTASTAIELQVAWAARTGGAVLVFPRETTMAVFRRDGAASPPGLQYPPLRRALAAALNRQQTGFTDSLGLLPPPVSWVPPNDPRWPELEKEVEEPYAYDPARAFRLLAAAGWSRDVEGWWRGPNGESLTFELTARETEAMQQTVARYWSEIGAQMNLTRRERNSPEDAGAWSGVLLRIVPTGLDSVASLLSGRAPGIPAAFAPGESDTLATRVFTILRADDQLAHERGLLRAVASEQPIIPLGFRPGVVTVAADVRGPQPRFGVCVRPWMTFNAHEWRVIG